MHGCVNFNALSSDGALLPAVPWGRSSLAASEPVATCCCVGWEVWCFGQGAHNQDQQLIKGLLFFQPHELVVTTRGSMLTKAQIFVLVMITCIDNTCFYLKQHFHILFHAGRRWAIVRNWSFLCVYMKFLLLELTSQMHSGCLRSFASQALPTVLTFGLAL